MTIKKSLLAAATASAVAIAGAGVANADEPADLPAPDVTLSADNSLEGVDLSDQAGQVFGSVADGTWDLGTGMDGLDNFLTATGLIVGSIAVLPGLYYGVKDFQTFVDDVTAEVQGFLPQ